MQYKQMKESEVQGKESEVMRQDVVNAQSYAQKELQNMANYKNRLMQKEEVIR